MIETYTVSSADWSVDIECEDTAEPTMLAQMVVEKFKPESFGMIIEVSGGKFTGDNVTYVHSEKLLSSMGFSV